MPPEKLKQSTGDPAAAWAVLAFAALAGVLAIIALWPRLDQPLVILVLVPAAAIAGAAAAIAMGSRREQSIARSATDWPLTSEGRNFTWRDVVAAMSDPAIVVDGSSTIIDFNGAAEAIFDRLSNGVVLERVLRDPELIGAIEQAMEKGEHTKADLAPRGISGRRLIAHVAPLGTTGLLRTGVLITIRDLSEQHRLLEMRSDFIANASHELRTPLASVRGFIETLQGPARNDETARKRFLSIMADQAERMTRLIDDLLLLSRVEEKANLRPTGRVDLGELIDEVVRSLAPIAAERQTTISVKPLSTSRTVIGDRDELFQVFQNLIENGVKYGHDGGQVDVDFATSNETSNGRARSRLTVKITDNGPGIAPEHLPRLTERFYRVNAEHSRKIGGTGLGLAIVKHVLNRHGAELHVESIVGTGTTFRVIIPLSTTLK